MAIDFFWLVEIECRRRVVFPNRSEHNGNTTIVYAPSLEDELEDPRAEAEEYGCWLNETGSLKKTPVYIIEAVASREAAVLDLVKSRQDKWPMFESMRDAWGVNSLGSRQAILAERERLQNCTPGESSNWMLPAVFDSDWTVFEVFRSDRFNEENEAAYRAYLDWFRKTITEGGFVRSDQVEVPNA